MPVWTKPVGFTVGELPTATKLTQQVSDNLNIVVRSYNAATATIDVVSTVAETTLYSQTITGNDLGISAMLRLTLLGDFLHNNVGGDFITLRGKFGGTTFLTTTQDLGGSANANRRAWKVVVEVANLGAANSQYATGWFNYTNASGTNAAPFMGSATVSADTTTAQTLAVTLEWSASSVNNSFRQRYGVLELVQT